MIYNYRTDKDLKNEIVARLRSEHTLSQGWGGGSEINLNIGNSDFVHACRSHYKQVTTRVPSNLTRIRDLKKGDLLVTPHLPEYGRLSIHVVAADYPNCYQYLPDADHQNHRISIEKSYGLDVEVSIRNVSFSAWYGKLHWIRLPLVPIPQYESAFRAVIDNPDRSFKESGIEEYLEQLRVKHMRQLSDELQDIRANTSKISFEAICKQLLIAEGYRITRTNDYDGKGGDIDIECVRDMSDDLLSEAGERRLFVQVKKHKATTDDVGVKQLLAMTEGEPSASRWVMSLGDSFSKEAEKLANENGVLLMNGESICRLLLKHLAILPAI